MQRSRGLSFDEFTVAIAKLASMRYRGVKTHMQYASGFLSGDHGRLLFNTPSHAQLLSLLMNDIQHAAAMIPALQSAHM